jgi:CO dehydrogenase/acetyl-CoA synthase alpha subunit
MWRATACLLVVVGLAVVAAPAEAQRGGKRYAVTHDRAFNITKDVLGKHGYEVVRIEVRGGDRVVYYRRGNMGRGRGKGPMQTLIIRRVDNRIVFVDVPNVVLVDIDVRLRL